MWSCSPLPSFEIIDSDDGHVGDRFGRLFKTKPVIRHGLVLNGNAEPRGVFHFFQPDDAVCVVNGNLGLGVSNSGISKNDNYFTIQLFGGAENSMGGSSGPRPVCRNWLQHPGGH